MTVDGKIFGHASVTYGEDDRGYLIAFAEGDNGRVWVASRSFRGIGAAVVAVIMGDLISGDGVAISETSQSHAVASLAIIEADQAIERASKGGADSDTVEELYELLEGVGQLHTDAVYDSAMHVSRRAFEAHREANRKQAS